VSIITEVDGKVTTRFPRVNIVQCGRPSVSTVPTTINQLHPAQAPISPPQFAIDQAVFDSLKILLSQPRSYQLFSFVCDHLHCSKTFCQFSSDPPTPHGDFSERNRINTTRFFPPSDSFDESYKHVSFLNPQEELLVHNISSSSSTFGVGCTNESSIPAYRRNQIDKIPKHVEIPFDS